MGQHPFLPLDRATLKTSGPMPADSKVVNAVGTQLRDLIQSRLDGWRNTVLLKIVAGNKKEEWSPVRLSNRFSLGLENERADAGRDSQT